MKMTLAWSAQEYADLDVELPSSLTVQGPMSLKRPNSPEAPGPPLIHRTTGSVVESRLLSTYPESQRADF